MLLCLKTYKHCCNSCVGESAGGNLAAAVALKLRDDEFQPAIKLQVLVYPMLQGLDFRLPSMIQNENSPGLPRWKIPFAVSS